MTFHKHVSSNPFSTIVKVLPCLMAPLMVHAQSVEDYTLNSGEWHQIAVPGSSPNLTINQLFGDDFGSAEYGMDWVVFSFNSEQNRYIDVGLSSSVDQTEGLWIIQATGDPITLDIPDSATTPQSSVSTQCTSIFGCSVASLADPDSGNQYAMIGSSQPTNVATNSIRFVNSSPLCSDGCTWQEANVADLTLADYLRWNPIIQAYDNLVDSPAILPWSSGWVGTTQAAASSSPVLLFPTSSTGNELPPNSRIERGDLLALHYDHCPDRDDGHATVAGLMLRDYFALDVLVIGGTCGYRIDDRYVPESEQVMDITWGSNGWLNAIDSQQETIAAAANTWSSVLSNGGDIWVAEGGPSDVTADIVRLIQNTNPQLNTQRIHVVQHSAGFNQNASNPDSLTLLNSVTDYILIPDGNRDRNGSADLKMPSASFVSAALASQYSTQWDAAFDYFDPTETLDFSDTVEVLYIVGDESTQDVDDFGNQYFSQ